MKRWKQDELKDDEIDRRVEERIKRRKDKDKKPNKCHSTSRRVQNISMQAARI
ncbi:hypothetical protein M1N06_02170 [Peptococcaceae bacterium]|nr:hypothetical protein [Peptococcaceae bacterium]